MTASPALLEISVIERNGEILASSDPARLGKTFEQYPYFAPVVAQSSSWEKVGILDRKSVV